LRVETLRSMAGVLSAREVMTSWCKSVRGGASGVVLGTTVVVTTGWTFVCGAALAGCVLASVARESEAGEETPSRENGGAVTLELTGGVTAGACSIGPSFIHCDISSTDEKNSSAVATHW
jgi:hypothetical protein